METYYVYDYVLNSKYVIDAAEMDQLLKSSKYKNQSVYIDDREKILYVFDSKEKDRGLLKRRLI